MSDPREAASPLVVLLADDLIWSTRLADGLRRAGARSRNLRSGDDLAAALPTAAGCLVDLTARAYDGLEAISAAAAAGVPVIAVGQHDDAPLRRAAIEAGAARVHAYRALFEHGDRVLGDWVRSLAGDPTATTGAAR